MMQRQFASKASFAARAVCRPVPRSIHARPRLQQQNPRFQSTSSNTSSNASGSNPAVIGALTGSIATLTITYLWYRQSGARELLTATKATKDAYNKATTKLKENTPEPSEALNWLRSATKSYASFIPGASGYVDSAFDDIDAIRAKHGDEVDKIVREAYEELRDITTNSNLSLPLTAQRAWNAVVKHLGRIGDLAGDAAEQIMDNHPQLKEKLGGSYTQLKEMGKNLGPEAKKEVDKTWDEVRDIVNTGMSPQNIQKIKSVIEEKIQKIGELGEQQFNYVLEQAQPYLEKNPKVKEFVDQHKEEIKDSVKKGKYPELFNQIKSAVENGDLGDLQQYIGSMAEKGGLGNIKQYLEKFPGGDQILPQLNQLQEVAQKHGDDAQRLMKETVNEISEILKKKGKEASEIAEKAKEESKK